MSDAMIVMRSLWWHGAKENYYKSIVTSTESNEYFKLSNVLSFGVITNMIMVYLHHPIPYDRAKRLIIKDLISEILDNVSNTLPSGIVIDNYLVSTVDIIMKNIVYEMNMLDGMYIPDTRKGYLTYYINQ